jgi:hypothetical protein
MALEEGSLEWTWTDGLFTARLATVRIHAVLVIEGA